MASLVTELKSKLINDSLITHVPLNFLVYDYWVTPGHPVEAFDENRGNRLRRTVVILDGGEVDHPSLSRSQLRLWDSFPKFYIYGEAHSSGKAAVKAVRLRIEEVLAPWRCNADEGRNITFVPDQVIELEDSDLFPGNVVSIVTWRATGARALRQVGQEVA